MGILKLFQTGTFKLTLGSVAELSQLEARTARDLEKTLDSWTDSRMNASPGNHLLICNGSQCRERKVDGTCSPEKDRWQRAGRRRRIVYKSQLVAAAMATGRTVKSSGWKGATSTNPCAV